MRVLIRSELYPPTLGGVQSHVELLARTLVQRGHEVHVLTTLQDARGLRDEHRDGVWVTRTPGFGIGNAALVGGIVCGMPAFIRHAPRHDVWHTHVLFAAVPAMLCRAVGRGRPHVITVHTSRFLRMAAQPMWHGAIRSLLKSADHVLAMSHELREKVLDLVPDCPVTALVNAVDTERFHATLPLLRPLRNAPVVVCPRRLVRKNGVDVLLEAWPHVLANTEAQLYICGVGEELESLEEQAERLRIRDSVVFHGGVEHHLMPGLLSSADVVVIPSRVEATSIAALEAMACERPVVSTNVGGLPEIIDERCGRLVEPEQPRALADALTQLLRVTKEERAALGAVGRRTVVDHWSAGPFVDRHMEIYERILAGR